jgi:Rrf2 family protein
MRLALTKRTDYAIRAFLCLARSDGLEPISSQRIAAAMDIPPRFVPHVLRDLARAGLVEATSGKRGGYRLARGMDGLSLLEVIEAVDGPTMEGEPGVEPAACPPGDTCNVVNALADARRAFIDVLADASFANIIGRSTVTADRIDGRESPERNLA